MDKKAPFLNTEIGDGSIDFKPIFAHAKLRGLDSFYAEQGNFPIDLNDHIKKSNPFIRKFFLP